MQKENLQKKNSQTLTVTTVYYKQTGLLYTLTFFSASVGRRMRYLGENESFILRTLKRLCTVCSAQT